MDASVSTQYSNTTTVDANDHRGLSMALSSNLKAIVNLKKKVLLDTITVTFDVRTKNFPKTKIDMGDDFWVSVANGTWTE